MQKSGFEHINIEEKNGVRQNINTCCDVKKKNVIT